MSFFWDMYQSFQINDVKSDTGKINLKSIKNKTDIKELENKIDALSLACHAMWELLAEKTDISVNDLESRIEAIDLRDGKKDGKVSSSTRTCPDCGHKVNSRHLNCYWCGSKINEKLSFVKS